MQRQRLTCNLPFMLGTSMPGAQKAIAYQQKKTRNTPIGSPKIRPPRIKTRLSPTAPPPSLTSLRPRPLKKINVVVGETIQPPGSMSPR